MSQNRAYPILLIGVAAAMLATTSALAADQEQSVLSRLNPFRKKSEPQQIKSPETRRIATNRFKPTRAPDGPKKSAWQSMSDGAHKTMDRVRGLFTWGDSKKPVQPRPGGAIVRRQPEEKKGNLFTSWLPWNKKKTR